MLRKTFDNELILSHSWVMNVLLTDFSLLSHFYNPENVRKIFDFLTFSGGIEMLHWTKTG